MNEPQLKKCRKCERELPANNKYFFTNKKLKAGLERICKECKGYKFQDYKNKNKSDTEGYKKCSNCDRELLLNSDYFNKSKNSRDGYLNVCKECQGYKFTHYHCKEGFQVCIKCLQELELNNVNFYNDKSTRTGYRTVCIKCLTGESIVNFNIADWYNEQGNIFKSNWSLDDIIWLYNNYIITSKQDLLKKFSNKKYKSITTLVGRWNLKKFNKNDNWSNEDIEFLINNYKDMTDKELKDKFTNRTNHAIRTKATKLDLYKTEDTIFRSNSESHKGYVHKEESKIKMSRNRRGSNSVNWKGGLSPLHPYFRSILYEWKMDSLKAYDYKCAFTGENNGDLEIHHINENFSNLIIEALNLLNLPIQKDMTLYNEEEIKLINQTFLELNYKYGLGIPLKRNIHQLYHSIYGKENNNKEQFEEFIQRYKMNEFTEKLKLIEENNKIKVKKHKPSNGKKYKKLVEDEVIEIRNLISKNMPDRYIANLFKVSETVIYNIKTNRTWKNVDLKEVV